MYCTTSLYQPVVAVGGMVQSDKKSEILINLITFWWFNPASWLTWEWFITFNTLKYRRIFLGTPLWSVKKENEEARASLSWKKTHIFIMELKKRGKHTSIYKSRLPYSPNVSQSYKRNLSSHKCQGLLNFAEKCHNIIKN